MANYEKTTLADVKKRLADGHYNSLTGALRGIGRMAGLTDRQKKLAQNAAREHFGEEPAAAAPKKAKKKSAKKTTKKKAPSKRATKKKATKKAAPKKSAKKAATKKKTTSKKKAGKKSASGKGRSGTRSTRSASSSKAAERKSPGSRKGKRGPSSSPPKARKLTKIEAAQVKIGTYQQALEAMEKAKNLGVAESEVAKGAKAAQDGLTLVVQGLLESDQPPVQQSVEPSEAEKKGADAFQKAAEATASSRGNGIGEHPPVPAHPPVPPPPVATPPAQGQA